MSERGRLTNAKRHRDFAVEVLRSLDDGVLADLRRRARYPVSDGYPASSMGASDIHGGRTSDPTGAQVANDAGGRGDQPDTWAEPTDRIADAIERVFAQLAEIAGIARHVQRDFGAVIHADARADPKVTSPGGVCDVCGRPVAGTEVDRLRGAGAGRGCSSCWQAWAEAGRPLAGPTWQRWATERRSWLAERGRLWQAS